MIIDISRTIIRKNIVSLITAVIVAIAVITLLFIPFDDFLYDLNNNILAVYLAVAYVIYILYNTFRNFNYIYYNDETDKLILRYFSPGVFTSKKNSIEIPKSEFEDYRLDSFFMRYREKLILFRRTKKGLSSYPPVSITALSPLERELLIRSLNELRNRNKKK